MKGKISISPFILMQGITQVKKLYFCFRQNRSSNNDPMVVGTCFQSEL